MKTKKIKNIDSKVNPFNPVTQKADYETYEKYVAFVSSFEAEDSDNWDDDIAAAWLDDSKDTVYKTDIICERINARKNEAVKLLMFNEAAYRGYRSVADKMNRDDYMEVCKIVARGCVKSMVRNSGDKYIMALASGEKPHDMDDLVSVAYETLMDSLKIYWSAPPTGKFIDLSDVQKRRVRRHNRIAWNHVMNESDYKMVEKTVYEWMRTAVYAHIQKQRGVRVNVPERVRVLEKNPKTGKLEWVEKVRNNSVYVPLYSTDDMTDGMYYTMKVTSFNTDDNGKTENPYMATLYKELKTGKIVTKKQLKYLIGYFEGDSYRTLASENGCHESTVRESVKSGLKKIEKWLIGHGYNVTIENGKATFKTWE